MRLSARLIVLILCSILVQGGQAIDIGFSASNGGKSVSMWNTYIVEDSISVSELDSVNPNGLDMTGSRVVSGSGDANMHQELSGSGGGADWTADHTVSIENAANLQDLSSTSLKPVSCEVSRSTNVWNCDIAENELYGHQGGDHAGTSAYVSGGDLSCIQNLLVGHSVEVSQIVGMNAYTGSKVGEVYGEAWDVDGNHADTSARVRNGELATEMNAKAAKGNSATVSQSTEMVAEYGSTYSNAWDADGNEAWTSAHILNGLLLTELNAKANKENSATATQSTEIEAERGSTGSNAWDADGNEARTDADMSNGMLITFQDAGASTGNTARTAQSTEMVAEGGDTYSDAWDADGNNVAWTYADMSNGMLITFQDAEASTGNTARTAQSTEMVAEGGDTYSDACDIDGNNEAKTYAGMSNGMLITFQDAEASTGNTARTAQSTEIKGEAAAAACDAYNWGNDYYTVYVENWAEGNAYLEFTGEAVANSNQFRASQTSHAEGLDIWPWAYAVNPTKNTNIYVHYNGNRDVESVAWANSNDVFADIQVV